MKRLFLFLMLLSVSEFILIPFIYAFGFIALSDPTERTWKRFSGMVVLIIWTWFLVHIGVLA